MNAQIDKKFYSVQGPAPRQSITHWKYPGKTLSWNASCGCWLDMHEYNRTQRVGHLYVMGHTSMEGAVALFMAIDPHVRGIMTYSEGKRDTLYRLDDGKWQAFDIRQVDRAAA
jgi:hypothetical protein